MELALQHVAMACVVRAGSRERALAHANFRVLGHAPGATGVARVHVRAHIYRAGSGFLVAMAAER